jgi:hypothetical protein
VTVVRPSQLQHPFADALWHQIIDDDADDAEDADDEPRPEAQELDEDLFDAPSEDDLYHDSDDWSGVDDPDDENEAA